MSTVTAIVVCYDESIATVQAAIDGLLWQSRSPDEILVVDNGGGRLARQLEHHHVQVRPIVAPRNLGYPPAINFAAAEARGDYLLCLNPDAEAEFDCLERLVATADADPAIAIVGAQILLSDHKTRNAGANPVHPTGISPAGGYGLPREEGAPRDVLVVSGACCLIRRSAFFELGGFVDEFFLYYDDVDLGWRANLHGYRVVYNPRAVVAHSYTFDRRGRKWFYLERNRLFTVFANYHSRTLVILAPLLLASEVGLIVVGAIQGWLPQKLGAYASLLSVWSQLRAQRKRVAQCRRRSDRELFRLFEFRLDSVLIPRPCVWIANLVTVPYLRLVWRLTG